MREELISMGKDKDGKGLKRRDRGGSYGRMIEKMRVLKTGIRNERQE